MKKPFRCLPVGNLPYDTDKAATKMTVKLFENMPFLANLPNASKDESLVKRTLMNTPGVIVENNEAIFDDSDSDLKQKFVNLDSAFNNPVPENLEPFGFDVFFLKKYYQIIARIKPAETVVNLLGPFSAAQMLMTKEGTKFISDKFYRKLVVQAVTVKALWIINKIKELSPETKPLIIFEEPLLNKAGNIKREFEDVTHDVIVNIFFKMFSKIKDAGANSGIQCFEKCDWQIPLEAGADLISFDAYTNPNNLNIIPHKINKFLSQGGRINWAIVPVANETLVKSLSAEYIFDRFMKTTQGLISKGANDKLVYDGSMVSIQGNIDHLPLIFAEKTLIIASQVAKRMPVIH